MHRDHSRQVLRGARVSAFEGHSSIAGLVLILAAFVAAIASGDTGGLAQTIALAGFVAFALCAASRGVRVYRAGVTASLPASVGKTHVRIRPARAFGVVTVALALLLPLAAAVAVLAVVEWAWLPLAGVLVVGRAAVYMAGLTYAEGDRPYARSSAVATRHLERLCMRADMPVPELVVEPGWEANAWATRGRIHVTRALLMELDQSEVEAVLAHELAHLGNRDAAVMDVCSAPSRMLLTFAGTLAAGFRVWMQNITVIGIPGFAVWVAIFAALSAPPAFLFGWVARLSVLRMSRVREFRADAAAAALTGRPSALASALVKLDSDRELLPVADLRQAQGRAVLSILGSDSSRLGPLFCTHPRTAERVRRLEEIEQRVQAGVGAAGFEPATSRV
jgi:heat shock protein HtpX